MIEIHGDNLTFELIESFLKAPHVPVVLAPDARDRILAARRVVETILTSGSVVYGINTGFGKLVRQRIEARDIEKLQRNLILSHACGVGPALDAPTTRLAVLLRAGALARGHSGIRLEVVEALLGLLTDGITPVVPEQGSVGASGDLAPLAHMALVLIGEGEAFVDDRRMSGAAALASRGRSALKLAAKEGLALINGTPVSTAIAASAYVKSRRIATLADIACALSLEALKGSIRPFDERVASLRPHPGHAEVAANMRGLLHGSAILASHADCGRVQDQYSLRCVPQVHGSCRDALRHVGEVLARELNSVTDNPLVFPLNGDVISAGNFHAEPVGMVADYAAIAVAELASISERRIETMVNPDLSGLPPFLIDDPGLNSGLMMAQVTAAALVSENKGLCHPATVDSIPTSANKEDHVSMAPIAARKLARVVENTANVLAIELLTAMQALHLGAGGLRSGAGVESARHLLGATVPPIIEDRILETDFRNIRKVMDDGSLIAAVTAAFPSLA